MNPTPTKIYWISTLPGVGVPNDEPHPHKNLLNFYFTRGGSAKWWTPPPQKSTEFLLYQGWECQMMNPTPTKIYWTSTLPGVGVPNDEPHPHKNLLNFYFTRGGSAKWWTPPPQKYTEFLLYQGWECQMMNPTPTKIYWISTLPGVGVPNDEPHPHKNLLNFYFTRGGSAKWWTPPPQKYTELLLYQGWECQMMNPTPTKIYWISTLPGVGVPNDEPHPHKNLLNFYFIRGGSAKWWTPPPQKYTELLLYQGWECQMMNPTPTKIYWISTLSGVGVPNDEPHPHKNLLNFYFTRGGSAKWWTPPPQKSTEFLLYQGWECQMMNPTPTKIYWTSTLPGVGVPNDEPHPHKNLLNFYFTKGWECQMMNPTPTKIYWISTLPGVGVPTDEPHPHKNLLNFYFTRGGSAKWWTPPPQKSTEFLLYQGWECQTNEPHPHKNLLNFYFTRGGSAKLMNPTPTKIYWISTLPGVGVPNDEPHPHKNLLNFYFTRGESAKWWTPPPQKSTEFLLYQGWECQMMNPTPTKIYWTSTLPGVGVPNDEPHPHKNLLNFYFISGGSAKWWTPPP